MQTKRIEKSISVSVAIVFICFLIYVFYNNYKLKKDGILVSAEVVNSFIGIKGNNSLTCKVFYNGKTFTLSSGSSVPLNRREELVGRNFPAIYLPNSSHMQILILPGDFEKYNLPYPDSLKEWYSRYVGVTK